MKDVRDVNSAGWAELYYEIIACTYSTGSMLSAMMIHSPGCMYSFNLFNCESCFACVGLKKSKYCIFNKQYSREEYEKLVPKIIENMKKEGLWGEFFPIELSPIGYNESVAQTYFKLTKEDALKLGVAWSDYEAGSQFHGEKYEIPDNIDEASDDICNHVLTCEVSGKPYKIIKQEFDFYKRQGLPLPRLSPNQRYLRRLGLMGSRKLFERKCNKCQIQIQTTYSPDRPEKIYCTKCYQESIL